MITHRAEAFALFIVQRKVITTHSGFIVSKRSVIKHSRVTLESSGRICQFARCDSVSNTESQSLERTIKHDGICAYKRKEK